jgi:chromate transporter
MDGVLFGLRPAVVSLIASAGLSILFLALFSGEENSLSLYAILLFIIGFIIIKIKKVNPIIVIVGCGVITVIISMLGITF